MMTLRPYQAEAVDAILSEWSAGEHRKTLLVLPTGCGKTVVFAMVTKKQVERGHRVLILAHRGELLQQASDKLLNAAGEHIAMGAPYAALVESNVPIVAQYSRIDTTQVNETLATTMAFPIE